MVETLILEILNTACTIFTITCALTLAVKGDHKMIWPVYSVAAVLGIFYFIFIEDWRQVLIWVVFLAGDLLAVRRHHSKKVERKLCPHCGMDVNVIESLLASKISFSMDGNECGNCPDTLECGTDDSFVCTKEDRTKNIERKI